MPLSIKKEFTSPEYTGVILLELYDYPISKGIVLNSGYWALLWYLEPHHRGPII